MLKETKAAIQWICKKSVFSTDSDTKRHEPKIVCLSQFNCDSRILAPFTIVGTGSFLNTDSTYSDNKVQARNQW